MTILVDELEPASFRGLKFQVDPREGSEIAAGRRTQLHEYPRRDLPYAQDMGRASRAIRLSGFLVGDDYITLAEALMNAFETDGPGELVHPWLGAIDVSLLGPATFRFDGQKRVARFHVEVVESGELPYPELDISLQYQAQRVADNVVATSTPWYESMYRVAGEINKVAVKALETYSKALKFLNNPIGAALGWGGGAANGLLGNINSLSALINSPTNLSLNLSSWLTTSAQTKSGTYTGGVTAPKTAQAKARYDAALIPLIRGQLGMIADPALSPALSPVSTPTERRIAANEAAALGNLRHILLSNCLGMSAYLQCAVHDDVVALRKALCAGLDDELLRLDEARVVLSAVGDPATLAAQAAALESLKASLVEARATVFRALTERARDSARLVTLTPPEVLPVLVLAYDYYEDAGRSPEIVERNRIKHPGFAVGPVRMFSQ